MDTAKQMNRKLSRAKVYDHYREGVNPTFNQECTLICCVIKFIRTHSMLDVSKEIDRYAKLNRGQPDPEDIKKKMMEEEDELPF